MSEIDSACPAEARTKEPKNDWCQLQIQKAISSTFYFASFLREIAMQALFLYLMQKNMFEIKINRDLKQFLMVH
jgi:hypothetical protein